MNVEEFHQRIKELYLPPEHEFTLIDVPEIRYMMIDGVGNLDGDGPAAAVKWLYAIVHKIKPLVKERMGKNFVEPPPEFLYWADQPEDFIVRKKDTWKWRVMIVFTDIVSDDEYREALASVVKKRGPAPESLRLAHLHEGQSVQIMHVGDYAGVGAVCERLYTEFLPANNLVPNGCYHEIYLNDPNRVSPEKRKVVIRQPVQKG